MNMLQTSNIEEIVALKNVPSPQYVSPTNPIYVDNKMYQLVGNGPSEDMGWCIYNWGSTLGFPKNQPGIDNINGMMDAPEQNYFYKGVDGTYYCICGVTGNFGGDGNLAVAISYSADGGASWQTLPGPINVPNWGTALFVVGGYHYTLTGTLLAGTYTRRLDSLAWYFDQATNQFIFVVLTDASCGSSGNPRNLPSGFSTTSLVDRAAYAYNPAYDRIMASTFGIPKWYKYDVNLRVLTDVTSTYGWTPNLTSEYVKLPSPTHSGPDCGPGGIQVVFNNAMTHHMAFWNGALFSNFTAQSLPSGTPYSTKAMTSLEVMAHHDLWSVPKKITDGVFNTYSQLTITPLQSDISTISSTPTQIVNFIALRQIVKSTDMDMVYVFMRTGLFTTTVYGYSAVTSNDDWYIYAFDLNTGNQVDQVHLSYHGQLGTPIIYYGGDGYDHIAFTADPDKVVIIDLNSSGKMGLPPWEYHRPLFVRDTTVGENAPKLTYAYGNKLLYLWGTNYPLIPQPASKWGVWYCTMDVSGPSGSYPGFSNPVDLDLTTDMTNSYSPDGLGQTYVTSIQASTYGYPWNQAESGQPLDMGNLFGLGFVAGSNGSYGETVQSKIYRIRTKNCPSSGGGGGGGGGGVNPPPFQGACSDLENTSQLETVDHQF